MIKNTFNYDPLECPNCYSIMLFESAIYPTKKSLLDLHEELAYQAR